MQPTPSKGFFRPDILNLVLLVLGFIGIFDASLLTAERALGLNLACGVNGGCSAVASDPSAFWFGIPVAYIGLAAYTTLTCLAAYRAIIGVGKDRWLVYVGYAMAAGGAAISLFLQYTMFFKIKAFCPYCFGSAVNMILQLITYALLANAISVSTTADAEIQPTKGGASWVGVCSLATVVAVMMGFTVLQSQRHDVVVPQNKIEQVGLMPKDDIHGYGDPKSKITIVEFADLCCIHCQELTPKLHQFIDLHRGKIWTVWRHFPLMHAHEQAVTAALVSEYAAEKGKFWDYADALMAPNTEPTTSAEVLKPAADLGFDVNDILKRIQDSNDKVYEYVHRDLNAANQLGIQSTPTFFIMVDGMPTKVVVAATLFDTLTSSPYKELLAQK